MRKMYMNKLMMSMYKLIVAKIYSSGDKVFMIICVSNMMNRQKTRAPPSEMAISRIEDCKNTCIMPPTISIHSPANNPECMAEKSRFVWKVYIVRPPKTTRVRRRACRTTACE
ncbi:hypothetical protein JTB14_008568 [Gonioctena quinquepunctata]|nr:hypothetical protein JTB14_008568 [Gonioctena quinquepunctata]